MTFNFLVNFWATVDENGRMTWTVTDDKISILYYFNNKNIDMIILREWSLLLENDFLFIFSPLNFKEKKSELKGIFC